ncbi:hypothetical protein D7Y06_21080 [Roseburia sp. 1XD42-69]|nr:DUF3879 family protein [Roseburia sp. 1XD42-69]RKJ61266.1 hypothetical protein D7Y06_21080 [Roseburia sp. 1XD42-69]
MLNGHTTKVADSTWEAGKPIPSRVWDSITRETVENTLTKSEGSLVKKSIDVSI